MTDDELTSRFAELSDYVESTVALPNSDTLPARDHAARPHSTRALRVLYPVLAAVTVAVVGISIALATEGRTARQAAAPVASTTAPTTPALSCPARAPVSPSVTNQYPLPSPGPNPLTVTDRLVPLVTPVHAVVCTYIHSLGHGLTGSRIVDDDLADIPQTLGAEPPSSGPLPCTSNLLSTDGDVYLIGLTYPHGTMWVSAPDQHCDGASNGRYTTLAHVATLAKQAYNTGTWAASSGNTSSCQGGSGRLGQEKAMVPTAAVSLTVCNGVTAKTIGQATGSKLAAIITALNRLPTQPDTSSFSCVGGRPSAAYTLIFRYSTGPPVVVTIVEVCTPVVFNGSLQANDAGAALTLVRRITTN